MQSRAKSLLEIATSVASGFVISGTANQLYYNEQSWTRNIIFTLLMTALSLARGYAWRRAFNWWDRRRKTAEPEALVYATFHPEDGARLHICSDGRLTRSAAVSPDQSINIIEVLIKAIR